MSGKQEASWEVILSKGSRLLKAAPSKPTTSLSSLYQNSSYYTDAIDIQGCDLVQISKGQGNPPGNVQFQKISISHQGGNLYIGPPPPWNFHIFTIQTLQFCFFSGPPPLQNFPIPSLVGYGYFLEQHIKLKLNSKLQ